MFSDGAWVSATTFLSLLEQSKVREREQIKVFIVLIFISCIAFVIACIFVYPLEFEQQVL